MKIYLRSLVMLLILALVLLPACQSNNATTTSRNNNSNSNNNSNNNDNSGDTDNDNNGNTDNENDNSGDTDNENDNSGDTDNENDVSEGDVLFEDDFSDSSSGWDQYDGDDAITDYADDAYRILVNEDRTDVWANPGQSFTDVSIEVDATKTDGPDDNNFGVLCRYQDTGNYYFLEISSDGFYGIGKVEDGDQSLIGEEKMQENDAINQGEDTNHIRADCIGETLTLYVNDELVAEVEDDSFASGDVGLIAGTFDETGTDILFDDFVVTQP